MRPIGLVLLLLFVSLAAPADGDQTACATSPEHNQWLKEVGAWSAARARQLRPRDRVSTHATRSGDVFVVPADVTNTPFRRPFDLEGRTLVFERQDSTGFAVRNIPLQWEGALGDRVTTGTSSDSYATVQLDFDFPFHGRSVRTIYITPLNGIFLAPPVASSLRQYGDVDLATEAQAVIAPLLSTRTSRLTTTPQVHVRKDGSSAAVTWTSGTAYSVRATLDRSGEIRFSYEHVGPSVAGAGIVITSGTEAWRG
ncbi:MAG TPA: hypothetical protein VFT12_11820, partial [Thermoanaerobaculia bacterium]|nr:hypothetical protein [Thermoanaerobaculia bacterium]